MGIGTVAAVVEALSHAITAYQAAAGGPDEQTRPLANEVKRLRKLQQETLTLGANNCKCGCRPLAVPKALQPTPTTVIRYWQIGCSGACRHSVSDGDLQVAIGNWNKQCGAQ